MEDTILSKLAASIKEYDNEGATKWATESLRNYRLYFKKGWHRSRCKLLFL